MWKPTPQPLEKHPENLCRLIPKPAHSGARGAGCWDKPAFYAHSMQSLFPSSSTYKKHLPSLSEHIFYTVSTPPTISTTN